jgi:hypothetical protein
VFLDRDGALFGHVLAYLRAGVVGVGVEDDVAMLGRLKQEFGYFCLDVYEDQEVAVVAGGRSKDAIATARVEICDANSEEWSEASPMQEARYAHAACMIDDVMFVSGGVNANGTLSSVERYSVSTDRWNWVTAMPHARFEHCAVAFGGFIYVIGGKTRMSRLSSVLKYDIDLDSWTKVASMPEPISAAFACAVGGSIFVFGGFEEGCCDSKRVLRYDVAEGRWSYCAPMPEGNRAPRACVLGGMVYVLRRPYDPALMIYDPETDAWSEVEAGAMGLGNVVVVLVLFSIGGRMFACSEQGTNVYEPGGSWPWMVGSAMGRPSLQMSGCSAVKGEVDVFDAMISRARRRRGR